MALPYRTDRGAGELARLGLILLQVDETLEVEARQVLAPGIACYHSRVTSHDEVTSEALAAMEADLPHAAGMLPTAAKLDAIGYACTSGATVIGTGVVAEIIRRRHPHSAVTDPVSAAVAALRALGAGRIGFLTPYVPEVSSAIRALLERHGIVTEAFASFEQKEERTVARICETSTLSAILELGSAGCDAVFASCTNLRTFSVIREAEGKLRKPVISSNSALLWHMLRLAGVGAGIKAGRMGPGRLFDLDMAP